MENASLTIIYLLGFLLITSIIAVAIIAYRYVSLKGQIAIRIKEEVQAWRSKEIEAVKVEQKDIALREAKAKLTQWKNDQENIIRQDAAQRSQATTIGKVAEHFIPYLPDFLYNPKDARFIGSPIDFIVFDGLNDNEVKDIVFIEIKTGKSGLNQRQRQIREAIQSGKVLWQELRHSRVEDTEDLVVNA
jgi:predicted Holliday junction resolvase-like endonuclease